VQVKIILKQTDITHYSLDMQKIAAI